MTTVINSPGSNGESVGIGMIVAVLVVIVAMILFFVYGLPALRNNDGRPSTTNISVEVPAPIIPDPAIGAGAGTSGSGTTQ